MSHHRMKTGKDGKEFYDKTQEHMDQSPLGKIQQQYWTTKQQVMKKLGKKQDEFIVLSDAELDSKLDTFRSIEQSSTDLLKVIEMYQDQLINLSIEESEMSTFLKSQATYDTKTKAGKMMAAVSKSQHFAAQHRNGLRLPLVRLYNEVETFRYRAVADTFQTIRKMENARTEYRGALLWMKDVSMELDPDAHRKLEKFRRVQAQVKKTKNRFDKLKFDVTQKIDMLAASRCNMFSHVLATYQKTLILFWTKTAKTFAAVSEAFKGYDHYEFNVIKALVDPDKRPSDSPLNKAIKDKEPDNDSSLDQSVTSDKKDTLIDFEYETQKAEEQLLELDQDTKSVDEVNQLIDLMTLNEASELDEQLKELELLEADKKNRSIANASTNQKVNELSNKLSEFGAFVTSSLTSAEPTSTAGGDLVSLNVGEQQMGGLQAFKEILSNASDEFEREWQSAFTQHKPVSGIDSVSQQQSDLMDPSEHFAFFSQISKSNTDAELDLLGQDSTTSSLFSFNAATKDMAGNILCPEAVEAKREDQPKSSNAVQQSSSNKKNLSAWYDLFAELDPVKNPDAIGQLEGIQDERNC